MRLCRSQASAEIHRQNEEFANWILQVGEGSIPGVSITEEREPCWIEIKDDYLINDDGNGSQNLINFVYPNLPSMYTNWEYLKERGILAPTNDDVDGLNSKILSMLPGDVQSYYSCDTLGHIGDGGFFEGMEPTELLNSLNMSGLPNHCLDLKVGAPVILLRNMNQSIGLCNGTRLIIKKLGYRVIEAQVITGPRSGDSVLIPRIDLLPSEKKIDVQLKRRQFPLKLAFSMTINKSQGQTLNTVGIFLPRPVFTHGQLYVAISRVTSPSRLKILMKNKKDVPKNLTKNVVYREVLSNVC
ncbi:ATP-dependent DNA helicase PIF1 [Bienertia sinuspersici]